MNTFETEHYRLITAPQFNLAVLIRRADNAAALLEDIPENIPLENVVSWHTIEGLINKWAVSAKFRPDPARELQGSVAWMNRYNSAVNTHPDPVPVTPEHTAQLDAERVKQRVTLLRRVSPVEDGRAALILLDNAGFPHKDSMRLLDRIMEALKEEAA